MDKEKSKTDKMDTEKQLKEKLDLEKQLKEKLDPEKQFKEKLDPEKQFKEKLDPEKQFKDLTDPKNLRKRIFAKIFPKRFSIIWKVTLQGYGTYAKVWNTIIGAMAVMVLLTTTVFAPVAFILPIIISKIPPINFQGLIANDQLVINNFIENIIANPFLWVGVFSIAGLAFAASCIFIGAIQKFAHVRGTMEEIFKDLIRNDAPWLALVGILMFFIIIIPLSIVILIFSQVSQIVGSQQPEINNIVNSARTITLTSMLIILICPLFLATASVVVGKKKQSSTKEAIILYKSNFITSIGTFIISLTPVVVLGIIFIIIETITSLIGSTTLSEQQILTSDPLTVINHFFNQYIATLSTFTGSFVGIPLLIITMSVLYKNTREEPITSTITH